MTEPSKSQRGIADRIAHLVGSTNTDLSVRIRAWDGSEAGPADGPTLILQERIAVRRILRHPNELGVAQAYLVGEIDVEGNLTEAMSLLMRQVRQMREKGSKPGVVSLLRATLLGLRLGGLGHLPPVALPQARLSGALHSRKRDKEAVAYHYDLSNDFFRLILGPYMAYSCAYWKSEDPSYSLDDAQQNKLELICRKLNLKPGMRMLDIGCGWGSLSLYAAQNYGVHVTAVTLSAQQYSYVTQRLMDLGFDSHVDVQLQDYRDLADGPYDAVAVIEMAEHVGKSTYRDFAAKVCQLLKPGGLLLMQQLSRQYIFPGGGRFMETYIAPDIYLRPLNENVSELQRVGLEVRSINAMREHYVPTFRAWLTNLEQNWTEVINLVGELNARSWRLYLTGGILAFSERRMGVDQILAVRPQTEGLNKLISIPIKADPSSIDVWLFAKQELRNL
jgi:cyclopropane-fatty-acyl-phospholipid synthase